MKKIPFVLCTLAFCVLTSCVKMPEEQHTSFETLTLSRETVTAPMTWSAAIRGKGDVSIVSRCTGTLDAIRVKDGQSVKKGDVLFLIDSRSAMNALVHAKADLQTALANCENARLEAESNKELADKGIISGYLLRKSLNTLQSAEAQVAQARAAVRDAELRLDYCTIKSPVNGLVGNIIPHVGDVISEGTMLTRVAGVSEMEASFSITESQVHAMISELGSLERVQRERSYHQPLRYGRSADRFGDLLRNFPEPQRRIVLRDARLRGDARRVGECDVSAADRRRAYPEQSPRL